MFNLKDILCIGGSQEKPCEDVVGYGAHYCFAMDGASGLSGINLMDEKSDAAWFAYRAKQELCNRLDSKDDMPTGKILREIMDELNREYIHSAAAHGIAVPTDSPSAGIALFRERFGRIEYFGIGDCTAVVQFKDGTCSVIKETALPALDQQVLNRMAQLHQETGVSVLEARNQCNDMLLSNRNLRNQEGGYWILDLFGEGVHHAREKSWPIDDIACVFAFTDGFGQLTDTFGQYSDDVSLFQAVQESNLEKLARYLFQLQDNDPEANAHPRFKLRDDTSALWGYFD